MACCVGYRVLMWLLLLPGATAWSGRLPARLVPVGDLARRAALQRAIATATSATLVGLIGCTDAAAAAEPVPLGSCVSRSNPAITTVSCRRYGLDREGRLRGCGAAENCVSTSAVTSPTKFAPPWSYASAPRLAGRADEAWTLLLAALERDASLTLVEVDPATRYARAVAPSRVPPGGVDDVEFRLDEAERAVFYRSCSREAVFVYPLQQPLSDNDAQRDRLRGIREVLGWGSLGYEGAE